MVTAVVLPEMGSTPIASLVLNKIQEDTIKLETDVLTLVLECQESSSPTISVPA